MRGSGGRGGALRAEEGQTGQQHSEPSAQAFTPETSSGSPPPFQEVLPAKARATGQEVSPKGGARLSDTAVTCQQLSTGSGSCWKYREEDSLAFSCSQSGRKADTETD